VSPIQLILTRRLLLAKQLLTETGCRYADPFASGLSSLGDLTMSSTPATAGADRLRRKSGAIQLCHDTETSTLQLDIGRLTTGGWCFLERRELKGIEWSGMNSMPPCTWGLQS